MSTKPPFALLSLLFTAGAIVLVFLTLLAGTSYHDPLNQIYFLRADTKGIPNAPGTTTWTLWNYCDGSSNKNADCGKVKPAYPFDPPRNFGTGDNVPDTFKGTHKFYLLSRFMFAFIIIGLVFAVCSLFTGVLAICSRLGGGFSGLLVTVALFFQTLAAAVMTACFVMGLDDFKAANRSASLGTKAFAFMWSAVAALFLAAVFFFKVLGTSGGGYSSSRRGRRRGMFGRSRSTRSRGSFLDRKDEYS